jgi:hypothetical protein
LSLAQRRPRLRRRRRIELQILIGLEASPEVNEFY